jgi:hypothetical protein
MSDPVWIALIAGAPSIIAAVTSFTNAAKLQRLQKTSDVKEGRLDSLVENVNGRMSQLLSIQHEKSYNQGVLDANNGEAKTL